MKSNIKDKMSRQFSVDPLHKTHDALHKRHDVLGMMPDILRMTYDA
jgi:hypothetical protein